MCKYSLMTVMLVWFCFSSCTNQVDQPNGPQEQKLENNLESTAVVDSIQKQVKQAEAELKTFLGDQK